MTTQYINRSISRIIYSFRYFQYNKLLKISKAINNSANRPIYILGGHGPSPEPEYYMNKTGADYIVIGEGEETIVDLLKNLSDVSSVKGIAYKKDNKVVVNERRPLIKNIDSLPFPAWELFNIEYYRLLRYVNMTSTDFVMPILSGRGCPFHCTFCYRMDEGFRPRSNESIIDEIKVLKMEYGINVVDFADELLMSSIARTESLCRDFLKHKLNIRWHCNGRLNFADRKLLRLMKSAGCIFINYGIEALDNDVLMKMKKALTVEQIKKGVEATLEENISPGLNIMWGNIGDNDYTLHKAVKFLIKYDDCAQLRTIRPVTPYPGSELYYTAIKQGLLKDVADFYENKHINSDLVSVNFTTLSNSEFHHALAKANKALIKNYYAKKMKANRKMLQQLYYRKNSSFRGFRQF